MKINRYSGLPKQPQSGAPFSALETPWVFDPDEIDSQCYLFDHRCSGGAALLPMQSIDTDRMGEAFLNERALNGLFFFQQAFPGGGKRIMLFLPLKGLVEHERNYLVTLRGFYDVHGKLLAATTLALTTAAQRQKSAAYEREELPALDAAREGMVLLQNDGVLPLAQGTTINIFGEGLTNFRIGTMGAGRINPAFYYTLREALTQCGGFALNPELDQFYAFPGNALPPEDMLTRAKKISDVAILIITRGASETVDNRPIKGQYYLTDEETALLQKLCGIFCKTAVILNTPYPIAMNWLKENRVGAVLYAGLAGQGGAQALAEILAGKIAPSGHLSDSWTWDYWDCPASENFYAGEQITIDNEVWLQTCYEEGIYVGYRYYATFGKEVAFCFGHGLSYTDFSLSLHKLEVRHDVRGALSAVAWVSVANIGHRAGKDVVQLYVKLPGSCQEQPTRQLIAFGKTRLLAEGETETLRLEMDQKRFATFCVEKNEWLQEQGVYALFCGDSLDNAVLCGEWVNETECVLSRLKEHLAPLTPIETISQLPGRKQWPDGKCTKWLGYGIHLQPKANRPRKPDSDWAHFCQRSDGKQRITWDMVREDPANMDAWVAQLSEYDLARMTVMQHKGWSVESRGEAGRLARLRGNYLPEFVCADGNHGVNLTVPNIGLPTAVMMCSTFNRDLMREAGRLLGATAKRLGIQMLLAVAVNIHRNPLGGRHSEYFSEDPYLAGEMAGAMTQGIHAAGVGDCMKHVACNNCESSRKRNHSLVDERALREIYLRTFETLMNIEKPDSLMTAYNALNGSMCAENADLLEGVFRKEMGFDGFIMTDWNSYNTVDIEDALHAGVNWLTPGEDDDSITDCLVQQMNENVLNKEILRRGVRQMLMVVLKRSI